MPRDQSAPTVSPVGVQTPQAGAVLGSPRCEVCRKPLGPRAHTDDPKHQQVVCSAACRAERWRRQRAAARRQEEEDLYELARPHARPETGISGRCFLPRRRASRRPGQSWRMHNHEAF
jgi:hypothetical protein